MSEGQEDSSPRLDPGPGADTPTPAHFSRPRPPLPIFKLNTRTHAILAPVVHLLASSPPHLICSLILHSNSLSIHLPFFTHPPTCNPRQAPCPQSWQSTQRGCATTAAPISPHRIASHHITSPLLRPVQSRLHPIDFAPGTVPGTSDPLPTLSSATSQPTQSSLAHHRHGRTARCTGRAISRRPRRLGALKTV